MFQKIKNRWKSLPGWSYIVLSYIGIFGFLALTNVIFPTELHMRNISVYEERDGTTYSINSTLEYYYLENGYTIKWYLNSTEIRFKNEGRIGKGIHIRPPDYILASFCFPGGKGLLGVDADKCFTNIKLDKITDNASEVLYANNTKFLQEIVFEYWGKRNLVVTTEYPFYSKQTFTELNVEYDASSPTGLGG